MTSRYRQWLVGQPILALLLSCALSLGACGSSSSKRSSSPSPPPSKSASASAAANALAPPALARPEKVTLILDFTPNAVHAGIYRALAAGYYAREHIELRVVEPTSTEETLKLIDASRAQFGLADGSDVAQLIDRGGDAEAVMALVQRPLGGLIARADEHLRSPADPQGATVGVTGVPSDEAVLDTELRHAGGEPSKVRVVNVGFSGAQALVARRIAAFTGFIPADGVGLQVSGHPIAAFALAANGGPPYPGLVAFTTRRLIASDPQLVRDFVAATVHGYRDTIADPARSLRELLAANPSLPRKLTAASLRVYVSLFDPSTRAPSARAPSGSEPTGAGRVRAGSPPTGAGRAPFGWLSSESVRAMSHWMLANRLIRAPIAPSRYGTNAFLP